jgi:hypothetical protein
MDNTKKCCRERDKKPFLFKLDKCKVPEIPDMTKGESSWRERYIKSVHQFAEQLEYMQAYYEERLVEERSQCEQMVERGYEEAYQILREEKCRDKRRNRKPQIRYLSIQATIAQNVIDAFESLDFYVYAEDGDSGGVVSLLVSDTKLSDEVIKELFEEDPVSHVYPHDEGLGLQYDIRTM